MEMCDRIIALILITTLSPVFLIAILGVLIFDFGPVFFKAERAGKSGKFKLIKFRSMRTSNNETRSKITKKNDDRIYFFGKILRITKIDELPQLINILRGEMTFVGPRPEDIEIVNEFYDDVMLESLSVKPGLTSPGSIYNFTHVENALSEVDTEDYYTGVVLPLKIRMEIVYIRNSSFFYDLKIIFKTIKVIGQKILGKRRFNLPSEYFDALKLREAQENERYSIH